MQSSADLISSLARHNVGKASSYQLPQVWRKALGQLLSPSFIRLPSLSHLLGGRLAAVDGQRQLVPPINRNPKMVLSRGTPRRAPYFWKPPRSSQANGKLEIEAPASSCIIGIQALDPLESARRGSMLKQS